MPVGGDKSQWIVHELVIHSNDSSNHWFIQEQTVFSESLNQSLILFVQSIDMCCCVSITNLYYALKVCTLFVNKKKNMLLRVYQNKIWDAILCYNYIFNGQFCCLVAYLHAYCLQQYYPLQCALCKDLHLKFSPEIVNHPSTFGILISTYYVLGHTNYNFE